MNGHFNFVLLFFHFIVLFPQGGKSDVVPVVVPQGGKSDEIPPFPQQFCDGPNTTSTSFDYNLADLFLKLYNKAVESGYSTAVAGQDGDELYGYAMCQPGMDETGGALSDCDGCLSAANNSIVKMCSKRESATIWNDNCTLRYSSANFFNSLDDYSHCMRAVNSTEEDKRSQLDTLVNSSMLNLSSDAAYNKPEKYSVGKANFNSSVTFYELVQCTTNLSNEQCYQCLSRFVELLLSPNCSSGRLGGRILGQCCYVRFEINNFFPLIATVPDVTPPPPERKSNEKLILIYIVTSIVLVLASSIFGVIIIRRFRRTNVCPTTGEPPDDSDEENGIRGSTELEQNRPVEPVQYPLAMLQDITENFCQRRKLGHGRFGEVFEGIIDGEKIAIKKLREDSAPSSRLLELGKEISLLAPLCHRNLVKLLGFCIEAGHYVLVYEFVENKDLGKHLKDSSLRQSLDWETRKKIIKGIADGLCYLHYESRSKKRIIHCDLKAENILLDERNDVKIADFGLSRILRTNISHESSEKIAGTFGYMAPEIWAPNPIYSPKADVYSFGVLLLEIMTKRIEFGYEVLTHDVWEHWKSNAILDMTDPRIMDECPAEMAHRFMLIGLLCVQGDRMKRPDMKQVVGMLRGEVPLLEPSYPGYYPDERRHQPQKKTWLPRIIKI